MTCAFEVRNLTFRYPTREDPAFRDVSFSVNEGEVVLLAGPSGCGKSTLALCLNGLIPHAVPGELEGEVRVYGVSTAESTPCQLVQRVGSVFQDPESQFCMLTVEEELAFGLENLGLPHEQMERRIDEALRLVGLEERRSTRLDRLSGGIKQRVALATALALGSRILVLDEPTANLDPAASAGFFHTVRSLRQRRGHTFFIVEHKLDALIETVDRMLVMDRDGSIRADGPPREVLQKEQDFLREQGIWTPEVCELSAQLHRHGIELPQLPMTVEEAAAALRVLPSAPRARAIDVLAPRPPEPLARRARPPAIEVRGLSFTYAGGAQALHDANLRVDDGDFVAIVGPNGSGKTTLALHLAGVLRPPRGTVDLFGEDLNRLSARHVAQRVGFVFQNPEHQFVTDRVGDELRYGPRRLGWAPVEAERAVDRVLAELDLAHLAEEHPFNLSQGQKRRLSVATMSLTGPRMLVLDEPTFGQDRASAYTLMDTLAALNRAGAAIVIVTHDLRLVAEFARQVAVMRAGRVIWTGAPRELFLEPQLLATAGLARPTRWQLLHLLTHDESEEQPTLSAAGGHRP